jgi:hypothetical protein
VTLEKLKLLLDEETTGNSNARGLISINKGDDMLTTFEVFLSAKDRSYLQVIFKDEAKKF